MDVGEDTNDPIGTVGSSRNLLSARCAIGGFTLCLLSARAARNASKGFIAARQACAPRARARDARQACASFHATRVSLDRLASRPRAPRTAWPARTALANAI